MVFGPFYSNYSTEQLQSYETTPAKTYNLNFTANSNYHLVTLNLLDVFSIISVNISSAQPTYVYVIQESLLPLYDKSTFVDGRGTLIYHVAELGNYSVYASAFSGSANINVTAVLSIVTRDKPYAIWGQAMYYGGIALLGVSIAAIVFSYARKEKPAARTETSKTQMN